MVDVLESEGVRHVFGNPGTTELPFMEELARTSSLTYVLGLQEATVVAMADGYAQATRRPAFVNLHSSAGLGNAMGNLTNAQANGTPLVVTAGQQDRRHRAFEPLLGGDLVELARPVAKTSREVVIVDELAVLLRRGFLESRCPPTGPVFLSIPMDLLDDETEAMTPHRSTVSLASTPAHLTELADRLNVLSADELLIVVDDEVGSSDAFEVAIAVAEQLACKVMGASLHGTNVFPTTHRAWAGSLPSTATAIRERLDGYKAVFLIGGQAFMVYPWTPGPPIPPSVDLLHLSCDPRQLGRSWPTTLGLAGDVGATLEALLPLLKRKSDALSHGFSEVPGDSGTDGILNCPLPAGVAARVAIGRLPRRTPVVNEAITTGIAVRDAHVSTDPGRYFFCRGGGLGWGMPAAVGVSLARGGDLVACMVGDGSALYSPQALWTAANHELPVVFVVFNNREYLILKQALRARDGGRTGAGAPVGMDIDRPPIDFVALGASWGVPSFRAATSAELGDLVETATQSSGPTLIEAAIA